MDITDDTRLEILLKVQKDFRNTLLIIGLIPLVKQLITHLNVESFFIDNVDTLVVEAVLIYRFVRHMIWQFTQTINMGILLGFDYAKADFWISLFFLFIPLQVYVFFKILCLACENSLYVGKVLIGRAQGVFLGISLFKIYMVKLMPFKQSPDTTSSSNEHLCETSPININIEYEDADNESVKAVFTKKDTSSHSIFYPFSVSIVSTKRLIKNTIKQLVSIIIQLIYDLFF